MDTPTAIVQINALKGQFEGNAEALGIALKLLTEGYASDIVALSSKDETIAALKKQLSDAGIASQADAADLP